jgi:glycosyltransferase involved in cell wall biosynthesis
MIKVLCIVNRFNLGGVTYNAAYLTKYMSAEYETMLVGGPNDKTEKNSEYILNSLGIKPVIIPEMRREINFRQDLLAYKKLKKIIAEFKPDVVHTHASKAGALGRRAAKEMGVKAIVHTFHGHVFDAYFNSVKSKFYQGIERRLAKKTDAIVAISKKQKEDLVDKYNICAASKVRVIPLGFDLTIFITDKEIKRQAFRKKYELTKDDVAIGIIGRIVPIKNHKMFLESFVQLKKKTKKSVKAFVVGDGELRQEIEQEAKLLGLTISSNTAKNVDVVFTSWIKEMDELNAAMDIVALTSLNEGTPVSLIEAQASGVPIVSTNIGGVEDIVTPNETALLVDSGNVTSFADSLYTLVENDSLRQEMSEKGWDKVSKQFSYQILVDDMSKLYKELLG